MFLKKYISTFFLFLLMSIEAFCQSGQVSFMTDKEQEVIRLVNYVRTQPAQFAEQYLLPLKNESADALECYNELKNASPQKGLLPCKALSLSSRDHALEMGRTGKVGHFSVSGKSPGDRVKKYARFDGPWIGAWENCSYGLEDPLDIVLQLLIDENIPDRGHRKNILNENIALIGVSIENHKTYGINCVMDMANSLTEK
ncbi:CAP domain-containing protein [soil metagenome]